ncbi:IS110 family RNA-guided transposase [Kineococcus auxinigenes]
MATSRKPVIIGVDPHKRSVTIEVIDQREQVLHVERFATDTAGYRALRHRTRVWSQRTWAVEGAGGVGKLPRKREVPPCAQRLVAEGETVIDVPTKLSAQVRVFNTGQGRKTDATDAHSIALAASRSGKLRAVEVDGEHVALRLLADRRDELGVRKTETANRIHRLLGELIGGGAKRFLSAAQAKTILAGIRPRDVVARTRRQLAAELIAELAAVEAKIKVANQQLKMLVVDSGSHLMELSGIGPSSAARLLGDVGDIARFPTRGHFASWNGTAPIDASSGDNEHHRLSRSGNRRLNRVLHIMAIVQLRNPTAGRAYFDRKRAEGKSAMEALRCLKRRLPDAVYRQMVADAQATKQAASPPSEPEEVRVIDLVSVAAEQPPATGPGGQAGASTGSSAADSDPDAGSLEKSLPGLAATSIATPRLACKGRLLT